MCGIAGIVGKNFDNFSEIVINKLKNKQFAIDIILTESAKNFISKEECFKLGANLVFDDLFDSELEDKIGHIELSRRSDLILIYPATANIIAKIAGGIADDLATTSILAANKKIMLAPAMNVEMWHNKATAENIKILEKNNIEIIGPEKGQLACGEFGEGLSLIHI